MELNSKLKQHPTTLLRGMRNHDRAGNHQEKDQPGDEKVKWKSGDEQRGQARGDDAERRRGKRIEKKKRSGQCLPLGKRAS